MNNNTFNNVCQKNIMNVTQVFIIVQQDIDNTDQMAQIRLKKLKFVTTET